jgi:hypothetical protein
MCFLREYLVMLRIVLILAVLSTYLLGQTPSSEEVDSLAGQLSDAIRRNDLVDATEIATRLDDGVQRRFRAWMNRDASMRVEQVLTWLPADIETIWALQEPIDISAKESSQIRFGKSAQVYALDRLMALNNGEFYQRLKSNTIRLTVAAGRKIRTRGMGGVPAPMPDADVTYFYFLADPLESSKLGRPDESLINHPAWRGSAKIFADEPFRPGPHEPTMREDESWLALAHPDLIILSSRRESLIDVLKRIDGGESPARPSAQSMPEWNQVDRQAAFWGIRHYSDTGAGKDNSNPRTDTESDSDRQASGISVTYDPERGNLEIRYLSSRSTRPNLIARMSIDREFMIERLQFGGWQLKASTRERGPFPFHFAMYLLGFGGYR